MPQSKKSRTVNMGTDELKIAAVWLRVSGFALTECSLIDGGAVYNSCDAHARVGDGAGCARQMPVATEKS